MREVKYFTPPAGRRTSHKPHATQHSARAVEPSSILRCSAPSSSWPCATCLHMDSIQHSGVYSLRRRGRRARCTVRCLSGRRRG
eukprot:scaffold85532_cov35-Tisochrysis_lutea.AAC.1